MYRYNIRIPQDISVIHCKKNKTLTMLGPLKKKSMRLELKIATSQSKKIISVSPVPFLKISNAKRKTIKALQRTTIAKIKHLIIECSVTIFKKLKLIGVGYRADLTNVLNKKILTLKLGFSHPIFIQIPANLSLDCATKTKFYIFGDSYEDVSHLSARIRSKKIPEPYKGKGILYEDEKIVLKEGKKI